MLRLYKNLFSILLLFALISPTFADEHENKPKWDKLCETVGDNTICQISFGQFMNNGDKKIWFSRVGVVELNATDKKFFIHSPLGVNLQSGVLYQIDENQTSSMPYNACYNIQGCQGLLEIDDAMINQLKNGNLIKMRFTSINGQSIDGTVSLNGFTAAYNK
ncbi:MAG: invasion associated locus B family protein [Hyphomicrobiales bacterium]|nr:invasion associated locus B family protein [Hyphomicrobiales bacterium]